MFGCLFDGGERCQVALDEFDFGFGTAVPDLGDDLFGALGIAAADVDVGCVVFG